MTKRLLWEDQICVRVARPLRETLENAALADGRELSGIIRKALVDFAAKHIAERAGATANQGS